MPSMTLKSFEDAHRTVAAMAGPTAARTSQRLAVPTAKVSTTASAKGGVSRKASNTPGHTSVKPRKAGKPAASSLARAPAASSASQTPARSTTTKAGQGAKAKGPASKQRPTPKSATTKAGQGAKAEKGRDLSTLLEIKAAVDAGRSAMGDGPRADASLAAALATVDALEARAADGKIDLEDRETYDELVREAKGWRKELFRRELTPGGVWKVPVEHLASVVERAVTVAVKTPLILDGTSSGVARTFFKYAAAKVIDAKGLVVRKAIQGATTGDLREELRQDLCTAMRCGYPVVIDLGNSAPDFAGTFCDDETFPAAVFTTNFHAGAFDGKSSEGYAATAVNCEVWHGRLARPEEEQELSRSRLTGRCCGTHPIVISDFQPDDADEFLRSTLPGFKDMQIIVISDS